MNKISKAAAALGRKGGSVKSERKAKSSAENGNPIEVVEVDNE